ncbi:MAG: hypothetical protein LBB81_02245 [Treponema sp.]|jgi:hypothetical protein|nr:hypothetical protein [Treponema sp.]
MKKILLLFLLIYPVFPLYSQNSGTDIDAAIAGGDCDSINNFLQNRAGKDGKSINNALQAFRRYTSPDLSTVKYRTDKMELRAALADNELTGNVFSEPEKYLGEAVSKMLNGMTDPFLKVKVLHDWICNNIAYDAPSYQGTTGKREQDYISVIKNKLGVCEGYSNLLQKMCELAKIESLVISGYAKTYTYTGKLDSNARHAWNAVKISNKWYLLDVTWDAGRVDGKTFIKRYSTSYLFIDSRDFLYTHLPDRGNQQFFGPAVTREQFMDEPLIPGDFFNKGLVIKSELPSYNNYINEPFMITMELKNSHVNYDCGIRTANYQYIEGASWTIRKGSSVTFVFDIPDNKNYIGYIVTRNNNIRLLQTEFSAQSWEKNIEPFVRDIALWQVISEKEKELFLSSYFKVGENNCYYFIEDQFDTPRNNAVRKVLQLLEAPLQDRAYSFEFNIMPRNNYSGYKSALSKRFPQAHLPYYQAFHTSLISPIKGDLKRGGDEKIVIHSYDFTGFSLSINGKHYYFKKKKDGEFELEIKLPVAVREVYIYGTKNNQGDGVSLIKFGIHD